MRFSIILLNYSWKRIIRDLFPRIDGKERFSINQATAINRNNLNIDRAPMYGNTRNEYTCVRGTVHARGLADQD